MDFNELFGKLDCYLVRTTNRGKEETFNEVGSLREEAIPIERIPNLSLNILGGYFNNDHISYLPKGDARDRWDGKKEIYFFIDYKDKFDKLSEAYAIYFPVNELHQRTFPFYHEGKDEETKKMVAAFSWKKEANGKYKVSGTSEVKHDPTNLNYWHVELVLQDHKGITVRNANTVWAKSAAEAVAHYLTGSAFSELPELRRIPELTYLKKAI